MLVYLFKAFKQSLKLNEKETPTQLFQDEYCQIVKNTYFKEYHLRMSDSAAG